MILSHCAFKCCRNYQRTHFENSRECPLKSEGSEEMVVRVAKLMLYGAETWRAKVNIVLTVRNFHQSFCIVRFALSSH